MNDILSAALSYLKSGFSILPTDYEKMPKVEQWAHLMEEAATVEQVKKWFSGNNTHIAMICGKVSGNALILDFDCNAEALATCSEYVEERAPGLIARLVIEKSPHGAHLGCRVDGPVQGNTKLARKPVPVSGPGRHQYKGGKPLEAIQVDGQWIIAPAIVETRGEGGYCVISPSKGYELTQGDYNHLPLITTAEMNTLLECGRACNLFHPPLETHTGYKQTSSSEKLPGQDYDERADIRPLLEKHGWRSKGSGRDGRERWARPGKDRGHSATLTDSKVFYVFSQNAHPFDAPKAYGPFGVYAILEHGGDFKAATKALAAQGYGTKQEQKKQSGRTPKFLNTTEMEKEFGKETEFLWRDYIPKGQPSVFAGREGEGKSSNVAQVCKETVMADPTAWVLWVATEGFVSDHADKWSKLRLPPRIVMLSDDKSVYKLQLDNYKDREFLDLAIETLTRNTGGKVVAVVIDSIRGMQSMGENDPKLSGLMSSINSLVCDKWKASCIYIAHHKKGTETNALNKVAGSTGITSSVRAVYSVERISQFVCKITPIKSNALGHNPRTYRSVLIEDDDGFEISIAPEVDQDESGIRGKAERFLIGLFKERPEYEAKEIYRLGAPEGLSSDNIKRAKNSLPIQVIHESAKAPWKWRCSLYSENPAPCEKRGISENEKPNEINQGAQSAQNLGISSKKPSGSTERTGSTGSTEESEHTFCRKNNETNKLPNKEICDSQYIRVDPDIDALDLDNLPPEGFQL